MRRGLGWLAHVARRSRGWGAGQPPRPSEGRLNPFSWGFSEARPHRGARKALATGD